MLKRSNYSKTANQINVRYPKNLTETLCQVVSHRTKICRAYMRSAGFGWPKAQKARGLFTKHSDRFGFVDQSIYSIILISIINYYYYIVNYSCHSIFISIIIIIVVVVVVVVIHNIHVISNSVLYFYHFSLNDSV